MSHKIKHKSVEKFFNDDTNLDVDTAAQQAYDKATYGYVDPNATVVDAAKSTLDQKIASATIDYGNTEAGLPSNVGTTSSSAAALNSFANFMGGSTLSNIEKGLGGLVGLSGQVAGVVNAAKGNTGAATPPKKPTTNTPAATVFGMSPTVLIGGGIFILAIAGVGIYLATRGGGDAAAPVGKGK